MTAFNDILTAEKEALQSIETAKAEMAELVSKARGERKSKIEEEVIKLSEAENAVISAHKSSLKEVTDKIEAETKVKVAKIEEKFAAAADNLKKEIRDSFVS
ncbi:hypothetical protein KC851_01545 [Candidatus Kaiserbacteria bacterium]|nr:hypothetical protein [Candidatus Kaiserbacteria bacterium]